MAVFRSHQDKPLVLGSLKGDNPVEQADNYET